VEKARDIMKTGVKYKDACHVSCALLAECDCFITTDKRLLKYNTDKIKMMNPLDFVKELEV
jgi:predicted nucleic acid-binding protein